jgi:hypothetical protein
VIRILTAELPRDACIVGAVGIAGALGVALVAAFSVETAVRTYLGAVIGIATLPIGALALLMMTRLVGGAWREDLTLPLSVCCRALPLSAVLFIPVLLGLHAIYPWAEARDPGWSAFKAIYLGNLFFAARAMAYFAIWIVLARLTLASIGRRGRAIASIGLIVYAITASLAAVDWILSLHPDLGSSIFGLIFMAHQMLGALALAIVMVREPARPGVLGGLLLSIVLLWGYLHAMQFIIVWTGDRPDEIAWYLVRSRHGWQAAVWILFGLQGAVTFLALLTPVVRANAAGVLALAVLTLAMRLLEGFWLTVPALDLDPLLGIAGAAAASLCCGGLSYAWLKQGCGVHG